MKAVIRFRIDFKKQCSIGPGKIDLLERIGATGSLSQAGRELGMSYRRAWLLLDSLNTSFREPVVATSIGGKAGGGATLTEFGAKLVETYRQLEKEFNATAAKRFAIVSGTVSVAKKNPDAMRTPLVRSAAPRRVKKKVRGRA
jgi:molybdate transport system regulatory protein